MTYPWRHRRWGGQCPSPWRDPQSAPIGECSNCHTSTVDELHTSGCPSDWDTRATEEGI